MSDKIINLTLVKGQREAQAAEASTKSPASAREPVPEVVEHLKLLLERAESGDLRAISSVLFSEDDGLILATAWGQENVRGSMVAGASLLSSTINAMALGNDIS